MNNYELIATVLVVPVISFLKRQWDIEGPLAFWISVFISIVAATGVFFVDGEGFTLENLFGNIIKIFTGAQVIYNMLKQTSIGESLK